MIRNLIRKFRIHFLRMLSAFSIAIWIGTLYLQGWPAFIGAIAGAMMYSLWLSLRQVETSNIDLQTLRQAGSFQIIIFS